MRIITYVETELVEKEDETDVYLLSIYDKSNQANISNKLIEQIVQEIQDELEQLEKDNLGSRTEEEE